MMVPGEVVLIGLFRVVNALGLIDTYLGMILSLAVNAVNFGIYNYMRGLPRELDEAAMVDGAGASASVLAGDLAGDPPRPPERHAARLSVRLAELTSRTCSRSPTACIRSRSAPSSPSPS